MKFKHALMFCATGLLFQPTVQAENLLDDDFFGFEGPIVIDGSPANWFIAGAALPTVYAIGTEMPNAGLNSLKFSHDGGVDGNVTAFSPPGTVALQQDIEYVISMDVWVEPGSKVGRIRPILESPFHFITPINLDDVEEGQWVKVISAPFSRQAASDNSDRLRLQVRPGDMLDGTGTLFVDNVAIETYEEGTNDASPAPFTNRLGDDLSGFEPTSPNWFIADAGNVGSYTQINNTGGGTEMVKDGVGGLVFETDAKTTAFKTAFSPNGSLNMLQGDFTVSMDIWIEPGSSINAVRAILENPFTQVQPFNVSNVVRGQWVRITSSVFSRGAVSGKNGSGVDNDRLRVQIRPDDLDDASAKFYIDNVSVQENNPRVRYVQGLSVTPSNATIFEGVTTQLDVTLTPANATNPAIIWTSSDETIATVDDNGAVTGEALGTATISGVTVDGGFSATTQVTVRVYENFVDDPGFESGTFEGWTGVTGQAFIVNNVNNVRSGTYALRIRDANGQTGYIERVVDDLVTDTRYTASVWTRVVPNNTNATFGVKNYGGVQKTTAISGSQFTQSTISFKTGATDTSVTLFVENSDAANIFIDDVEVLAEPEIPDLYDPAFYDRDETTYIGPIDQGVFLSLMQKVNEARDLLSAKIIEAEEAGVNTEYAQVTAQTVDLFKDIFAPYDRENPLAIEERYNRLFFTQRDPVGAAGLPFDELADSLIIVETAIDELQQQIDGEIVLATPPDWENGTASIEGSNYLLDGKPVLASKFFFQPDDDGSLESYGRNGEKYIAVQDLEDGTTVKAVRINSFVRDLQREVDKNKFPMQFFVGHIVPNNSALRDINPVAFEEGHRMFTDYDIDNPSVRGWLGTLFDDMVQPNIDIIGDNARVYMLANEPTFGFREGGAHSEDGLSTFTFSKYEAWLAEKYGTIAALNAVYGTEFAEFTELSAAYAMPLALELQGGPVWYDWNKFNMSRVNDWFTFLHNTAHGADPQAKTHIKVLGERAIHGAYADEGYDFEYIAKLVDIPGSDNQMNPADAEWDVRLDQSWRERYQMEWRKQAIMLDFNKSIAPNKPFYDSEWHSLSGARWRDFHMTKEYVRAAFWLAATQGMDSTTSWVWNRRADGSVDLRADFVGTSSNQPIQLDAYGRSWKEINAHGEVFMNLAPVERAFMVYYNKDSHIQDNTYTAEMSNVHEALKVTNLPVGFTTPTELANIDKTKQTVVVPPTEFISDADLAALMQFSQNGGRVVVVSSTGNFSKTEVGADRAAATAEGLSTYAVVDLDEVFTMATAFNSALASVAPEMSAGVEVTDAGGNVAFGVLVEQLDDTETGDTYVSLINVGLQPLTVDLTIYGQAPDVVTDVITSQEASSELLLEPMAVRLLKLEGEAGPAPGDLDGDGDIDFSDIVTLSRLLRRGPVTDLRYDFNNDGVVNTLDVRVLRTLCTRTRCSTRG